jgi:L-seryl-tRNA(Ser) seleniumtransferase
MRAVRPSKLVIAALEATLELCRDGRQAEVPVFAMLASSPAELEARARRLAERCRAAVPEGRFEVTPVRSAVGGGALPGPGGEPGSFAVAALVPDCADDALDAALRAGDPPLVGRIAEGRLLFDVRTLTDPELEEAAAALRGATQQMRHPPSARQGAPPGKRDID